MSEKEIFEKISEIIEDRFEIKADEITENLNFQEDLDADSIDIVEFVLELEDLWKGWSLQEFMYADSG